MSDSWTARWAQGIVVKKDDVDADPTVDDERLFYDNGAPITVQGAKGDMGPAGPVVPISCAVVSLSNIAGLNSSTSAIDGVTLSNGDLVLLVNQSTPSQNGLWQVMGSGAWTRPDIFASTSSKRGFTAVAMGGTHFASTIWVLTTGSSGIVVDRDPQIWNQSGARGLLVAQSYGYGNTSDQFVANSQNYPVNPPFTCPIVAGFRNIRIRFVGVLETNTTSGQLLLAISTTGTDIACFASINYTAAYTVRPYSLEYVGPPSVSPGQAVTFGLNYLATAGVNKLNYSLGVGRMTVEEI